MIFRVVFIPYLCRLVLLNEPCRAVEGGGYAQASRGNALPRWYTLFPLTHLAGVANVSEEESHIGVVTASSLQ